MLLPSQSLLVLHTYLLHIHLLSGGISCLLVFGGYCWGLGFLGTGLISTVLSLAWSRHSFTLPFTLGTRMKLLHHSDVLSMLNGTNIQLKDGCLKASHPCLCLHASPIMAIMAPDVGPESSSLSSIPATVAAWIATFMTAVSIASISAISACILCNSLLIFWSNYIYLFETYSWHHVMLLASNVICSWIW